MGIFSSAPVSEVWRNGLAILSTRTQRCSQMKCRERLRISAPGSSPASHKNLEAVANAEHEFSFGGLLLHRFHDRRESRDGAASQVIAVGKASGENDEIVAGDRALLMPDVFDGDAEILQGDHAILIAIGTGKSDDGSFHVENQRRNADDPRSPPPIFGEGVKTLFVSVIGDDEEGVDDAGKPAEKGEHETEEEASNPAGQQDRDRWKKEAEKEVHGGLFAPTLSRSRSTLKDQSIIFDHGIGEQIAADFVKLRLGLRAIEFEFDEFSHPRRSSPRTGRGGGWHRAPPPPAGRARSAWASR